MTERFRITFYDQHKEFLEEEERPTYGQAVNCAEAMTCQDGFSIIESVKPILEVRWTRQFVTKDLSA